MFDFSQPAAADIRAEYNESMRLANYYRSEEAGDIQSDERSDLYHQAALSFAINNASAFAWEGELPEGWLEGDMAVAP